MSKGTGQEEGGPRMMHTGLFLKRSQWLLGKRINWGVKPRADSLRRPSLSAVGSRRWEKQPGSGWTMGDMRAHSAV